MYALVSATTKRGLPSTTESPNVRAFVLFPAQGVLSVSEGALVLGPALKRLALSGFTRIDADNRQGVYAVMSPQAPTHIAPPDYPASPVHVGRSTLSSPPPSAQQQQQQNQHHPAYQPQQQQQNQPTGWLSAWVRGRAGHSTSTFSQQLGWILRSSAGDDTAAAAAAMAAASQQQQQLFAASECKFRLELTVSRADDFWVASAATNRAAAAAAAAVPSRAAMHSLHQKIGAGPAAQQTAPQQQQQGQETSPSAAGAAAAAAASPYVVQKTDAPFVDSASDNSWDVSWQYFAAEEADEAAPQGPLDQQQQHQEQQPPHPVSIGRRSAMEVPLPTGLSNTILQIPLIPAGSPSIGVLDEYDAAVAADADYAAGYEAGYAAAAAEAEAAASAAVAAAEAARTAAAAIAALPRQYPGAVRALHARDFPVDDRGMLNGATGAAGSWQHGGARSMIEQQTQGYPAAGAAAAAAAPVAAAAATPSGVSSEAVAAEAPQDDSSSSSSSSRYGVRDLFDAWLLPCSHPKQRDTQACQQHLLNSALHGSGSSSRALEFGGSSRQLQPKVHVQGLLISENCNARWALSATALPPGGLEVQALWYALLALLVCLLQVRGAVGGWE